MYKTISIFFGSPLVHKIDRELGVEIYKGGRIKYGKCLVDFFCFFNMSINISHENGGGAKRRGYPKW